MRQKRVLLSGATYHVIARVNRGEYILTAPMVKTILLLTIRRAKGRYAFRVESLCIMDNHIHLMIRPQDGESLSRIMQWILSVFALRYNRILGLKGHVWYDRFKSVVIRSQSQFAAVFRYILQNPVRAGLVREIRQYKYGIFGLIRCGPEGIVDTPLGVAESYLTER